MTREDEQAGRPAADPAADLAAPDQGDRTDPAGLAPDVRPITDRPHGGVRDPAHPEFFDVAHRELRDPVAEATPPERQLVVDAYTTQVRGAGSRTQADLGRTPPPGAPDPRDPRDDAEPGST
jgi:hypothetical protein